MDHFYLISTFIVVLGAIVMFGLLFTMFTTVTFLPAMLTGVLRWRERRFAAS